MKNKLLAAALLALAMYQLPAGAENRDALSSLRELKNGNHRYVAGKSTHPRIDPERRRATALEGQRPIASILGCADSRVPPEILFDQGFAQLFVARVAGNVAGMTETASLEYGVVALKIPLIVVLGHTQCGAVEAAIANKPLPGSLPQLVSMIRPSVDAAAKESNAKESMLDRTIKQNVLHAISELMKSPVISEAVKNDKVKIVGGIRHIHDGHVDWLGDAPAAK